MTAQPQQAVSIHGAWSGRLIFILAAASSAVGLGSIWKLPYIIGQNGGGAFVLVYLGCVLLLSVPLMMAEIMIGRRGRQSPVNSFAALAIEAKASSKWRWVGVLGVLTGFLILSYYSVIGGWVLAWLVKFPLGLAPAADAATAKVTLDDFFASPAEIFGWHTLFMLVVALIVMRGVERGLEQAVRILMPGLLILLVVVVAYSAMYGNFSEAVAFIFTPDFSQLTWNGVVVAMGHSFFTMSIGMGALLAYGAYMPAHQSIAVSTVWIIAIDTLVSLLAGLAMFPLVFASGLSPAEGPGLMFVTLPVVFEAMPGGIFLGGAFFLMVLFAAWGSAIGLVEPFAAWLVERGASRVRATLVLCAAAWALGIVTVLSFNILAGVQVGGRTLYELLDYVTANVLLPVGGVLLAIFAGWVMKDTRVMKELAMKNMGLYLAWRVAVRVVAPSLILVVLIVGLLG
ncbi:MAG: sodium-dependent transporter [Pseudomonadota bacterium]